jgi:hypothetical protein
LCQVFEKIIRFVLGRINELKNELSIFLCNEIHYSNLFCVSLKTSFWRTALNCATYDPPVTWSDWAEIFTIDTWKYPPEVELGVFISDLPIRIYRVLKARNPVLARTFRYFFYKKKESEIFEKAQNYL